MDAILISLALNLAYLLVGVLALWLLVHAANHLGITGRSFHLGQWLDVIAGAPPESEAADRKAMAIVIAGLLVAGALLVSPFIRG